jgi:beta-xylosidase
MIKRDGTYYLFYSGNSYANATYAVGIARGSSPSAAMAKPANPILVTDDAWVGPGHCSVLDTPAGVTAMIFHAWTAGCVNTTGCGRHVLVDEVTWGSDGWPTVPLAPSATTRPLP